jgi:FlaG/FlaF family flagellin (archaellin)
MLRSKKALSPLIAAVLLIVVVVGIGAVVTGMVRNLVSENKETIDTKSDEMTCSRDVVISIVDIDGEPQICEGVGYINFILENSGAVDIDDFQLMVFGTTGIYRNESISASDTLTQGEAQEFNGNFSSVGTTEQVKIVPKLRKSRQSGYHFCNDVALTYEDLDAC